MGSSADLVKDELAEGRAERCYTEKVSSSLRSSTRREAVARRVHSKSRETAPSESKQRSMTWSTSSRQLDSSCGLGVRMT
jgi:hypothetical protein